MAIADSVPGVSGGTIAFILGFYERLIGAIHALSSGTHSRKAALLYLVKIGVGWAVGLILSLLALSSLLENHIYFLSSVFLGLTAASIPFILFSEKEAIGECGMKDVLYLMAGFLLVAGLAYSRNLIIPIHTLDYRSLKDMQYVYLFVSGMLAITAMVLPGISGSTMLLIFGVYLPTIDAARSLLQGNFDVFFGLSALTLGILFGLVFSVRMIRFALERYRTHILYVIIGLILGSFYAIMMGPTTLKVPKGPLNLENFEIWGFLLGVAILLILEKLKDMTAHADRLWKEKKK